MHDPKFEKAVQQKMEELEFSPPEAVWLNVERAVNSGRKKRRLLPFWLFIVPGLLLLGGSIIYFAGARNHVPAAATASGKKTMEQGTALPGARDRNERDANAGLGEKDANAGLTEKDVNVGLTETNGNAGRSGEKQTSGGRSSQKQGDRDDAVKPGAHAGNDQPAGLTTARTVGPIAGRSRKPGSKGPVKNSLPVPGYTDEAQGDEQGLPDDGLDGNGGMADATRPGHRSGLPSLSLIDRSSLAIKAAKPVNAAKKNAGPIKLNTLKRPWEAGFAGGAGISSLNEGLLNRSSVQSAAYNDLTSAIMAGRPTTFVSNTQPDLSFWAGVLLQKGLRKDLTLSLGLNLHYYSSRIKTGEKVNYPANLAVAPPNYVIGTPSNYQSQAYPYYSPGNNKAFVNRYYFLELPASISLQVGHNRMMPVFWEAGVSVSYLVSSNSLYYNSHSGVFYKDGSVINKTQASVSSALMVGLPIRGLRIQAGPQFQYGFTSLLNEAAGGGQHLLYGGIKLVILPGKAKK